MARLILDTTALIAIERGDRSLVEALGDGDDVALATASIAELLVGVELADVSRHPRRVELINRIVSEITAEDYTAAVAKTHASLMAHVRRTGRPRGAHDLIIAATALATERIVVTADSRGFAYLPGLEVRLVSGA